MPQCPGIKRDGGRCTVGVSPGVQWCFNHDPARADERRRNASRAGRGGGTRDVRDLKRRISGLIDDVLEGRQERGRAAVAMQGFNALRAALELERKIKETDDLEARIEELERGAGPGREGQRWGA